MSKVTAVQVQDENGKWRTEIKMSAIDFDEDAKGIFLSEYKQHGRMGAACEAAKTTSPTVRRHMRNDKDFALAMLHAEEAYQSRLIEHHQDLVFNGTERISYDRNGCVSSKETIYPIQLIAMELRKHDEGYRDKREVALNVTAGVIVAPPELSMEEWEKQFGRKIDSDEESSTIIEHDPSA